MSLRHFSEQADLELGEHAFLSVRQSNELRERELGRVPETAPGCEPTASAASRLRKSHPSRKEQRA